MQVANVDDAEGCVATGYSLGIIHRGRDEIVDIEVLDVEGLAHLRAARAQKADNLLAILDGIELSLDAIRAGCDLTKRQSGRKDLNEESVHENAS